jgi:FkbM family methyltransferase
MLSGLIDRLRQWKQRRPHGMTLPDGNRITYRDVDLCIIDEIYKGKAYGNPEDIKEGDVVIDCGGHIGAFTLWAAKRAGPSGRVLTFEPAPDNLRLLRANVKNNALPQAKVFDCALADRNERAYLYLAPAHGNPAANTLQGGAQQKTVQIQVRRLDDIVLEEKLARIDLLKIDVEGAELKLLAGAQRTLALTLRLVMELHPEKIDPYAALAVLETANFKVDVVSKKPHSWLVAARK